jgi:hypothetical protein
MADRGLPGSLIGQVCDLSGDSLPWRANGFAEAPGPGAKP